MGLRQKIDDIIDYYHAQAPLIEHSYDMFKILEGELKPFIVKSLRQQITSDKAFKSAKERIPPLNLPRRVNNKLSKIYSSPVIRRANQPINQELVDYYVKEFGLDNKFATANRFYNLVSYGAVEPYLDDSDPFDYGVPKLRSLAPFTFLAYSDDKKDKTNMTVFIKIMGEKIINGEKVNTLYLYSNDEFLAIDTDGNVLEEITAEYEGINPYGVIQAAYVNRSDSLMMPLIDATDKDIGILIPILLSDLGFAIKFMSHSILYGVNVSSDNLELNPDSFWVFQSKSKEDKVELGVIKPEVDSDKVLTFIKSLVAMWLETKNVKPGQSTGDLTVENISSGISQVVQNVDISEDRKEQMIKFEEFEQDFWDRLKEVHNYWAAEGLIEERRMFTDDFEISVHFQDPRPFEDIDEIIDRQIKLIGEYLSTPKIALKEIYPNKTEEEIDEILLEIEEFKNKKMEVSFNFRENMDDGTDDEDPDPENLRGQ